MLFTKLIYRRDNLGFKRRLHPMRHTANGARHSKLLLVPFLHLCIGEDERNTFLKAVPQRAADLRDGAGQAKCE